MTVSGGTWIDSYDNRVGVWQLGTTGTMDIVIPNAPVDPNRNKKVWLQLTWDATLARPVLSVDGFAGTLVNEETIGGTSSWLHSTWSFTLPTNPASETVFISGNVNVDEVVVDTVCAVPEPTSILAMLTGVVGLAGLSWKKRC